MLELLKIINNYMQSSWDRVCIFEVLSVCSRFLANWTLEFTTQTMRTSNRHLHQFMCHSADSRGVTKGGSTGS